MKRKAPARRTTATNFVPTKQSPPLFVTWSDQKGKALAFAQAAQAAERSERAIRRTVAASSFQNVGEGGVSVRDGFSKLDYDYFRPGEQTPRSQKEEIAACMTAYKKIGLVRNIVDLMADFAVQGITLCHPNPQIERFYQTWARKVAMRDRTERFLNLLYRAGNVIIRRHTAKMRPADVENMRRGTAAEADVVIDKPLRLAKGEIPWQYTVMNPLTLTVLGGELAPFIGSTAFSFAIEVPATLLSKLKNPRTDAEKQLLDQLPKSIRQGIQDGTRYIPLQSDKVRTMYYKRDDWEIWASPMTAAIMDDLTMLRKMKLADLAALDGVISQVRLWKLGSLEHKILPTEAAISKLADMLLNNVGGGVIDLIWGPELEFQESKTDVHHFLGSTKYEPVLNAIYAGLGIPPTLTGSATASGFTNNFISLKTMTERLQYGRDQVTEFWNYEIGLVQQSMGFRQPATLRFDRMSLADEAAEKALLIQLADRDLISFETILERFGEDSDIEEARLRREARKRKNGQIPEKAGAFHNPQGEQDIKKLLVQSGSVTPAEVGVDLAPKKDGEKTSIQQQGEQDIRVAKNSPRPVSSAGPRKGKPGGGTKKGVSGQGRPTNSKDSSKRKQKKVKPRVTAGIVESQMWVEDAQRVIAEVTATAYLQSLDKKNLRQLTNAEAKNYEDFKFAVLCNLTPNETVNAQAIARIATGTMTIPVLVGKILRKTVARYEEKTGSAPATEMLRRIQAAVVACWHAQPKDEALAC